MIMSPSNHKRDINHSPLYHHDGSSSKVGYFKAAHVKINFDELFRDFPKTYRHMILSGVHVKWVKKDDNHEPSNEVAKVGKRTIKFHLYYFVLRFTFPMLCLFKEVICSMRCDHVQCS